MALYKNVVNAIIIDDRGYGVRHGMIAELSEARADRINAIRPGSLVRVDGDESPPVEAVEPTPAAEVEVKVEVDPRDAVKALHWKTRVAIAERLGGGDNLTRRQADRFFRDLDDAALDALQSEVEAAKG